MIDEVDGQSKKALHVTLATQSSIFALRDGTLCNIMDMVLFQNCFNILPYHKSQSEEKFQTYNHHKLGSPSNTKMFLLVVLYMSVNKDSKRETKHEGNKCGS